MMKKLLIVILSLFILILYFYYFQTRVTAIVSYSLGGNNFLNCNYLPYEQSYFCKEGNAKNIFDLKNVLKSPNASVKQDQHTAELIGLGIQLAENNIEINHILIKNISLESKLYILDGYYFGKIMLMKEINNTNIPSCNFEQVNLKNACQFGIGRSLYFRSKIDLNKRLGEISTIPDSKILQIGYSFASSFAGRELDKNINNQNYSIGLEIAKEYKNTSSVCLKNKIYFLTCLDKNNLTTSH